MKSLKTSSFVPLLVGWLWCILPIGQLLAAMPVAPAGSSTTNSISASGDSHSPVLSADGRWLAFVSQANNLVNNDDLRLHQDVFLRDLANRSTFLVSVNTNGLGGGNAAAGNPGISSNGQWVVFESSASNLVPNDDNGLGDVFVRDLTANTTRLVSVEITGQKAANGKSGSPLLSADGRWVVFESMATNLVSGQFITNLTQVYARDLQSSTTLLVSVNADGTGPGNADAASPAISADGRVVAFVSAATNLVLGVTNQLGDIYVRDLQTGIITWASSNVASHFGDSSNVYQCINPVLSAGGDNMAFAATSPSTNQILVFWCDLVAGTTTCIATNSPSYLENRPELSADGRFVAYECLGKILVWDRQTQSNTLVNVCYDGINPGNRLAESPGLSGDGRTVAFISSATDLISSNAPGSMALFQVFARNLDSNVTWLLTATMNGLSSPVSSEYSIPTINYDGSKVAFESADDQLVANDDNRASDVFVHGLPAGVTELASIRQAILPSRTGTGDQGLTPGCLSADGRSLLVISHDSNLSAMDANGIKEPYLLNLMTGSTVFFPFTGIPSSVNTQLLNRVVLSAHGNTAVASITPAYYYMGYSCVFKVYTNVSMAGEGITWTPNRANSAFNDWKYDLSPDGRWLAFSDPATSAYFPEPVSTGVRNIGLRDLFSQTNVLISCQYSNTLQVANGPSTDPSFSPDGRWLLFYSQASDLIANQTGSFIFGLFAFDRQANTMRFISRANSLTGAVFSANSQYVAFSAYEPLTTIPTVYRFDMLGTNPVPEKVAGYGINPTISTNGQWIAFQLQKTGSMADIYVADAAAGTQELISVGLDGVSGGNRNSSAPQISPDGRFVLFASQADNLVPGDANAVTDIFLRDRQLGLTYLLSANPKTGHAGNGPSTSPVMSTDGSTVVFASYANDLFAGDFNDKQDVFVVKLTGGDRDGDGLDDAWEMVYFGNLDRDGSGDFDGDGLTDREEYRAGTDPANRGSVLRALVMAPVGGSSTTLRWPAAKDGHYQVQFKRSVTDAEWTVLTTTITVTGNTASATDEGAGLDAARFYRIVMLR